MALSSATDVSVADRLAGTGLLWDAVAGKFVSRDGAGVIDVTQPPYNCRGDAIVLTDATIGAGALSTVTSATASFQTGSALTASDVGKAIFITGADTSARMLHTTITAVVDAHTVTIADAAAGAVTGVRAVFGTNNLAGIQAAINAAGGLGSVYLPAGTHASPSGRYLLDSPSVNNLKVPLGALGLSIGGTALGGKSARLELGERVCSGFLPDRQADDQTCQNVTIHDLGFDANNVALGRVAGNSTVSHTGGSTVVFGTYLNGGWSSRGQRMNFANVSVERCFNENVPTNVSVLRQNVSIACTQVGSAEALNTLTDVTIKDCDFTGGGNYGVVVIGAGGGTHPQTTTTGTNAAGQATVTLTDVTNMTAGQTVSIGDGDTFEQHVIQTAPGGAGAGSITLTTNLRFTQSAGATVIQANVVNVQYDRVRIERVRHDTGLSNPVGYTSCAGWQVGGIGYGGRVDIIDFTGRGSGDTGGETDSAMVANHVRCSVSDYANSAYLAKNFAQPENNPTGYRGQVIRYIDCEANLGSQFASNTGYGWCLNYAGTPPTPVMGSVFMRGCRYRSFQGNFSVSGHAIMANGTPVKRLTVRDFEATLENVTQNYTTGTGATLIAFSTSLGKSVVKLKDVRLSINGTVTGGANLFAQWVQLTPNLSTSELYFEVDGLIANGNLLGGPSNGNTNILNIGGGAAGSYHGKLEGLEYEGWATGDAAPKFVRLGDGAASIKKRVTVQGDFSNNPGGFDVSAATGLFPQIDVLPGTTWVNLPNLSAWPPAAGTVTTPASGNAYRNVDLVPEIIQVNPNGATITDISVGRTNGTQHPNGTVTYSSTGYTGACEVYLENGDYLKLTYSVATPILTRRPRR